MSKIICLVLPLFLFACLAGGAYPERNGRTHLESMKIDEKTISSLTTRTLVTETILLELYQKTKNNDVVYLILANPGLSKENQIKIFKSTENDYARSGLARNEKIDDEVIKMVMEDESHTVYSGLAWNDTLTTEQLRTLKKTKNVDSDYFAHNIHCPPEIEEEILNSNDTYAKDRVRIRKQNKGK